MTRLVSVWEIADVDSTLVDPHEVVDSILDETRPTIAVGCSFDIYPGEHDGAARASFVSAEWTPDVDESDVRPDEMPQLAVGDEVVMRDVNELRQSGPVLGVVTKVGRVLVKARPHGHDFETSYRLDNDLRSNDTYEHGWLQTPAQYADERRRKELVAALREHDVEVHRAHKLTNRQLARVLGIVRQSVQS